MNCPTCEKPMGLCQKLLEPHPVEFVYMCFNDDCDDDGEYCYLDTSAVDGETKP